MFRIKCRVSGGVTGTQEAYLKERGVVQYFQTRKEAQTIADNRNKLSNGPYRTADFSYTVEPA